MSKNSSKPQQLFQSLVKYDTPYLVSTALNNKKALNEIALEDEQKYALIHNIFNRDKDKNGEFTDYSVKDALNLILPPKKTIKNEQLWVEYVSCTPVTKAEVQTLKEGLDKRIKTLSAKESGICTVREQLYSECFDELIRQVTINCLERGILMMLVKTEYESQMKTYQNLYQSSIAYGIRTCLIVEDEKKRMRNENEPLEEECDELEGDIERLEKEIEDLKIKDNEEREEENENHRKFLALKTESVELIKNEIRNKWEIWTKQQQVQ